MCIAGRHRVTTHLQSQLVIIHFAMAMRDASFLCLRRHSQPDGKRASLTGKYVHSLATAPHLQVSHCKNHDAGRFWRGWKEGNK